MGCVGLGDVVLNIWYFKPGCHVLFEEAAGMDMDGYCTIDVKVLQLKFTQKFLDKNYDIDNKSGDMVELIRPGLRLNNTNAANSEVKTKGAAKKVLAQQDSWADLYKVMGAQAMIDANASLAGGPDGEGTTQPTTKTKTPKHLLR